MVAVSLPEARARPALLGRERGLGPLLRCEFASVVVLPLPSPWNLAPSDDYDAACSNDVCPRQA